MVQAIAAYYTPSRAVRLSERLRTLSSTTPDTSAGTPQTPAPPPHSATVPPLPSDDQTPMACLHCGSMLPRSCLPACPVCGHSGFLLLHGVPIPHFPPDLLNILPSLQSCAPTFRPQAMLTPLAMIADWLEQLPPSIYSTAFRITPPLPVGDLWTCFWSLDLSTDWTTATLPSRPPPSSIGVIPAQVAHGQSAQTSPGSPPSAPVLSHVPPTSALRRRHGATRWLPCLPQLFCVHTWRHAPFCTHAHAPRCVLTFQGLHPNSAVPVLPSPGPPSAPPHFHSSCSPPHLICEPSPPQDLLRPTSSSPLPSRS